jgi:Taurine catabolism dioxygenase TauD, TfdA family
MTFGSRRDCATSGRFQRFSLISLRLGEGRLAGLNGRGFGRTDSAKQLEAGTMTAILDARTAQDSETPATPVFAAPIRHPSAWTVADFRSPADYSVDLDAAQLRDIAAAIRSIKAAGIGLDGLQREHFEVPSLRPVVEEIRRQVEDGRGFVLLRRLPVEDYSKDDLGLIFWGIGTHLGRGLSQSVMGDRLGHVKDFSREDPGARAYRNKQELSPHTDSCDLVGLLCLRNAQAGGGVSRLTSAISVHNTLRAEHPDVLEALYRGYVRHRRGEERPGELPYTP